MLKINYILYKKEFFTMYKKKETVRTWYTLKSEDLVEYRKRSVPVPLSR